METPMASSEVVAWVGLDWADQRHEVRLQAVGSPQVESCRVGCPHNLTDPRGKNTQLPLADLLRQSLYSRLAGYEDVNDAQRLSQDPTFRLIGSEKVWDRGAALTSRWAHLHHPPTVVYYAKLVRVMPAFWRCGCGIDPP